MLSLPPVGKLRFKSEILKTEVSSLAACSSDQVKLPSTNPTVGSEGELGSRTTEYLAVSSWARNSSMRLSET